MSPVLKSRLYKNETLPLKIHSAMLLASVRAVHLNISFLGWEMEIERRGRKAGTSRAPVIFRGETQAELSV